MVTKAQNELLTRVENDAPMGRMMRENYWIPFALKSQLPLHGDQIPVRLLGENYVAFRAPDGRIGFFEELCPHRRASLNLARMEDGHLRCIFHGWKFDVTGQLVECPSQLTNAEAFCARIKAKTYPVHEAGGLAWVWLGNSEAPAFPDLPLCGAHEKNTWLSVSLAQCNWLQGVEGTLDSAHVGLLHKSFLSAKVAQKPGHMIKHALAGPPVYETDLAPYGLRAAALRPSESGQTHLRVTEYFMPFLSLNPMAGTTGKAGRIFIASPVDDTHHLLFFGTYSDSAPQDAIESGAQAPGTSYDINNYAPLPGGREQRWGQDRALMRAGHYSGFRNNLIEEDMVVQASMGPILDRTRENLSSSDVAVVQARRMLLEEVARFSGGGLPRGSARGAQPVHVLNPIDVFLPPGLHWKDWKGPGLAVA